MKFTNLPLFCPHQFVYQPTTLQTAISQIELTRETTLKTFFSFSILCLLKLFSTHKNHKKQANQTELEALLITRFFPQKFCWQWQCFNQTGFTSTETGYDTRRKEGPRAGAWGGRGVAAASPRKEHSTRVGGASEWSANQKVALTG